MKELDEQEKIKGYILGEIGDEDRSAIEERIMTDDVFFQKLEMVEEELIQNYVDGNLAAADRANFEKRFLVSAENRQKVKFARALRKVVNKNHYLPEPQKHSSFFDSLKAFFRSPIPAAFGVLIILGFAGFFIWKSFSPSTDSEIIASLNKAYRAERPLESRITGLDYASLKNTRGGNDSGKINKAEVNLANALASKAASENETAESLHSLGRVYLTEKKFDDAIEQFEKAVKLAPSDAKLYNDLGAALMEKAETMEEGKLENLTTANKEFAKAIELDKNLLDAYFNQALCLQKMPGSPQAKEAWQKYLELDSTTGWAEEARKNLETLETNKPVSKTKEEILRDFLQAQQTGDHEKAWQTLSRNRKISEGKLIPQQLAFLFVDAKLNFNQAKAGEYLDALVYAGKLEEENSGDLFWKAMADFYSNVSNDKIPILKKAQTTYLDGIKTLTKNADYKNAVTKLELSQNLYRQAGNNVEPKLLEFIIGYCINRDIKIGESNEKLSNLYNHCQKENYKWLAMQANIWLATNDFSSNKFSDSLLKFELSQIAANETNDLLSQQKILSLFTDVYFAVGQFENAFDSIQKSLFLGESPDASMGENWRTLNAATRLLNKIENYNSALFFEQEALALARQSGDKTHELTSSVDLGLINFALGNSGEALRLIENGREICETFTDESYKNKCLAYPNLQLGHLKRQNKNYAEATENYQKAINFYDKSEFHTFSYDAHRGLLLSYLAEKNDAAVQIELTKILQIFKTYREQIIEEQNRNSFFDNEQDVYDIAVEISFDKSDFKQAFDYSEESRSRSLLDLQNSVIQVSTNTKKPEITLPSNIAEPLKLDQIQAQMPENVQLLQYSVLKDKTLIWLIDKNNLIVEKTEISSENLKEKIADYFKSVSSKNETSELQKASSELFDILIKPIKEKLDTSKEVFIIPDKFLFNLPFDTLYSGKYLIEDYRISYAPSANVFLFCSKKAGEFGEKNSENLLIIGDPKFNQTEYQNTLQPLPSAKQEADEIGKIYDNPKVFTDEKATKERFKENIKTADVVHFAGHYITDDRAPLLSSLILAGDKKEDSSLANYEIIGEKHPQLRLIVLSACRTGVEKYYNGEGMIGAARTFLATGVPLVVASQWAVDSDSSKELMVRFHRLRKTDRLPTAEALRRSQIEMIRNAKYQQPYYWAAFAAIGGYTKF